MRKKKIFRLISILTAAVLLCSCGSKAPQPPQAQAPEQAQTAAGAEGTSGTAAGTGAADQTGSGTAAAADPASDNADPADAATEAASPADIRIGQQPLNVPDDNYRTYYEIFVYSFSDSDGDGIGDLRGVTEKLDYVADLGCNGIWLMPIMQSTTYHKYDVVDYMSIDAEYGTLADFEALITRAHELGIRVIIDLAINHTSSEHPWFKEACAYLRGLGPEEEPDPAVCPYVSYYHFSRERESSTWYRVSGVEWFYEGSFWDKMPDLDLSCEALWTDLQEMADFWIAEGVDGFRMDAPLHYEENRTEFNANALGRLYEYCKAQNPDFYMVSEVWASEAVIADYYQSGTPSMFNFDAGQAEGMLIRGGNGKYSAESFVKGMLRYEADFSAKNHDYIDAPFLTNHDMPRVANALNNKPDAMKRAAGLLMTMRGCPFVYYGEEIGMKSSGTKDENKRLPMIWSSEAPPAETTRGPRDADKNITSAFPGVAEQLTDPDSVLNYYRRAIRLRNENPELARGLVTIVEPLTRDDQAVVLREWKGNSIIAVAYNTGEEPLTIDLAGADASDPDVANVQSRALYGFLTIHPEEEVTLEDGKLTIPAGGIAVLR